MSESLTSPSRRSRPLRILGGSRPGRLVPYLSAAGLAVLGALLAWQVRAHDREQVRAELAVAAAGVQADLDGQVRDAVLAFARMAERWAHWGDPSDPGWRRDAALFLEHFEALQALAWLDREGSARWWTTREGTAGDGSLAPWLTGDPPALAQEAALRGRPLFGPPTGPAGAGRLLPLLVPLAETEVEPESGGALVALLDADELLDEILADQLLLGYGVDVSLFGIPVYRAGVAATEATPTEWLDATTLELQGAPWILRVWPSAAVLAQKRSWAPPTVLGSSLLLAFAFGAGTRLARQTRQRARNLEVVRRELERSDADPEQLAHVASHDPQEPLRHGSGLVGVLDRRYGDHAHLEALFEHALDAILLADGAGRYVDANPAAEALTGYRREELLGLRVEDLTADGGIPGRQELWDGFAVRGEQRGEFRLRRKDGSTAYVQYRAVAEVLPGLHLSFLSDMSDRKLAEEELRRHAERLQLMMRQVPAALWTTDRELRFTSSLGAGLRPVGLDPDEIRDIPLTDVFGHDHEVVIDSHRRALEGEAVTYETEFRGRRFHAHVEAFHGLHDEVVGVIGVALDVTERQKAESALRTSEERYRRFFEEDLTGDCIVGLDGQIHACNPAFVQIFGFGSVQEALASDVPSLVPDREVRRHVLRDLFREGRLERYGFEAQKVTGEPVYLIANAVAAYDENDRVQEIRTYLFDDTERHLTETQLRQAQKMEAVGRLAGGVAHDFNNLVTAINGYSDLLLARLREDAPERTELEEIRRAGQRAAALTRQLLAFSRSQVLRPTVLDLNRVIGDTGAMLHRLLGEDVRLVSRLAPGLAPVRADAGQLEQVLLNLAVNARDAMPRGGELLVETSEEDLDDTCIMRNVVIHPGSYVTLSVTDTGEGMPPDVVERVFEPFFTTKEPGKGTGLGLSTVYGIVKQTGGYIFANSEPGEGTTFKLYLPRAETPVEAQPRAEAVVTHQGRGERVLVVEDEDAVRSLIGQILRLQGYDVIEAPNGRRALDACSNGGDIDLVVSDVVMPDVRGPDLERDIRKVLPDVPMLFISGYPGEAIARRGELPEGTPFLQKPFTHDALTRKVRELLG